MRKRGFSPKSSEFEILDSQEAARSEATTVALPFRIDFLVSFFRPLCTVSSLFATIASSQRSMSAPGGFSLEELTAQAAALSGSSTHGAVGHGGTGEFGSGGVRAEARSPVGGGVAGGVGGLGGGVGSEMLMAV